MEVDTDLQRDNDVTENASFNGLDEASEDVKMIAVETSPRKSKVCTAYFYASACRRISSYIEFVIQPPYWKKSKWFTYQQ